MLNRVDLAERVSNGEGFKSLFFDTFNLKSFRVTEMQLLTETVHDTKNIIGVYHADGKKEI